MHATTNELPVAIELPQQATSRRAEWGDLEVATETYTAGLDLTDTFAELPDGRCPCPHWGYLVKGRMRVKYADHDEVISAGEVYYLPPGHIPVIEEDTELVKFSPKDVAGRLATGR